MRILKLKLRGSIGIWKGLGLEEIEIDFTQFEPGLIAITGRNGSGKTTMIENLHPYRTMVSRDGSLHSHFFLKDSYKILEFEYNNIFYRSMIYLDALTGASEAYLEVNDGVNGVHFANDGKVSTYDLVIEHLLGSQELFFNSVFSGQKSKGVAQLKPADRRKLFYELLNLDSYDKYLESAKENLKTEELALATTEGEIKAIGDLEFTEQGLEESLSHARNEKRKTEITIDEISQDIQKVNETLKSLDFTLSKLEDAQQYNDVVESEIQSLTSNFQKGKEEHNIKLYEFHEDLKEFESIISTNGFLLKRKEEIETALITIETLEKTNTELSEKHVRLISAKSEIQKKYHENLSSLQKEENNLSELKSKKIVLEKNLNSAKDNVNRTISDIQIIDKVPCTEIIGAGCQFLLNAFGSKHNLEFLESEVGRLSSELKFLESSIEQKEEKIKSYKTTVEVNYQIALAELDDLAEIEASLKQEKQLLAEYYLKDYKTLSKNLITAEHQIELYRQKYTNTETLITNCKETFSTELNKFEKSVSDLRGKIDNAISEKIDEQIQLIQASKLQLNDLNQVIEVKRQYLITCNSLIAQYEQQIDSTRLLKAKLIKLKDQKAIIENNIKDWTILCKAFDKTGIPVLKLENSGIEITSVANDLLSLFESKFRIAFETTSLTKDKKKTKETFDINVVDSDGVCEISNKSGGQQVIIETAIQLAISLVVRKQGRNIQTAFLDEKDGALDMDNAFNYFEMLRKSHNLSGVHNTFAITHRTELLDFIPQQIKLENGILSIQN